MDGVTFNTTHSSTWGLYLSSTDIDKPTPKTSYVDIPFGDGSADLSEASGEVKYQMRTVNMKFSYVSTSALFETKLTSFANELQGQKVKIIFDKDPTYYYWGRLNISYAKKTVIGEIIVEAICDPYKYKLALTTQTETITLVAGLSATNIVANGDFSNSTTGWQGLTGSTIAVASNILQDTGSASSATPIARPTATATLLVGHKIYSRGFARVTNANCTHLKIASFAGVMSTDIANPVQNQWYELSGIASYGTEVANSYAVSFEHQYADAATANGKVMEVKYVSAFDLTTIYGAGNEPTKAAMDTLMSGITNSWFNGTGYLIAPITNKTVTIPNDRKKAYPKITTSSGTTVVKDGVTYTYGTVSNVQTVIPLNYGANTLLCTPTSSGNITFSWQEGAL